MLVNTKTTKNMDSERSPIVMEATTLVIGIWVVSMVRGNSPMPMVSLNKVFGPTESIKLNLLNKNEHLIL